MVTYNINNNKINQNWPHTLNEYSSILHVIDIIKQ